MKRTIWILAILAVLAVIFTPSILAQTKRTLPIPSTTSVTGTVQVYIPFSFTAGEKTFVKGDYLISPIYNNKGISIRKLNGGDALVILTNSIYSLDPVTEPKLVFHRYGDQHFLAQTWLRYSETGSQLTVSPAEIKLAREMRQEQVTLMASK